MTPLELDVFLSKLYTQLEHNIISDVARRIKENAEMTETSLYQIKRLNEMGYNPKQTKKELAEVLNITIDEVDKMLDEYTIAKYGMESKLYLQAGLKLKELSNNSFIGNLTEIAKKGLIDDIKNLSNTIGFVDRNKNKYVIKDYLKVKSNEAILKVSSGAFSVDEAIRDTINEMAESGVRTIAYESGVTRHLESTIRNNVKTGASQLSGKIALKNAQDMDCDLMEITAHAGARPSHSVWQGKIVSLSGDSNYLSLDAIGYGDVAGFKGANCFHDWYPFFDGISVPNYTKEQLDEFNSQEKVISYNGKDYTLYEATQKQRQIERSISKTKRVLVAAESVDDKKLFEENKLKLQAQRKLYKDFSNVADLPLDNTRTGVYNFDRKINLKTIK